MVLDGENEMALHHPDKQTRATEEQLVRAGCSRPAAWEALGPAATRDGHRVEVVAAVDSIIEARQAATAGAEGVGLLRTEFLFRDRTEPPSEEEQHAVYAEVTEVFSGRPITVRTLDVEDDQSLSYLSVPTESNPLLGLRGIRLCLARPDLFRTQLRAIVRAAGASQLRILFPMVTDQSDLRAARALLAGVLARVSGPALEVGILIEVPSAVLLADTLASEVDFFSVDWNELAQYTLATDRHHRTLAARVDGLHPAVLRLVERTVQVAHQTGKRVGFCGELGADPVALPILVGLGVDELSVNTSALATVKARIRSFSFQQVRQIAASALRCSTIGEVRDKARLL